MSISSSGYPRVTRASTSTRRLAFGLAAAFLVVAMGFNIKVIKISNANVEAGFNADAFGMTEFPKIQAAIEAKAVEAVALAAALTSNKDDAIKKYGVVGGAGPKFAVTFTGTVGQGKSGVYALTIPGLPENISVRIQTGPAINGTDIRDATGTLNFQQFKNQIEFQNAGSALNKEMKNQVLSKLDATNLSSKTVSGVGVFQLVNPNNWFLTPVRLETK